MKKPPMNDVMVMIEAKDRMKAKVQTQETGCHVCPLSQASKHERVRTKGDEHKGDKVLENELFDATC
jgi:hypothetical protein